MRWRTWEGTWGWTGAVLLTWAIAPLAGAAQEGIAPPRIAAVAGAFVHDLGDGGTSPLLGLRLSLPLLRHFAIEPGLAWASYERQPPAGSSIDDPGVPLLMGDLQVQGRYPLDRFTPYLGVGIGTALNLAEDRAEGEDFMELTYTAAAGVRADLLGALEGLAEARLRGIEEAGKDATELVLGLSLPF